MTIDSRIEMYLLVRNELVNVPRLSPRLPGVAWTTVRTSLEKRKRFYISTFIWLVATQRADKAGCDPLRRTKKSR